MNGCGYHVCGYGHDVGGGGYDVGMYNVKLCG